MTTIMEVRKVMEQLDLEVEALIAQRDTALRRVEALTKATASFESVASEAVDEARKWRDTARAWKAMSDEWRNLALKLLREKRGNAPNVRTAQRTGDEGV